MTVVYADPVIVSRGNLRVQVFEQLKDGSRQTYIDTPAELVQTRDLASRGWFAGFRLALATSSTIDVHFVPSQREAGQIARRFFRIWLRGVFSRSLPRWIDS